MGIGIYPPNNVISPASTISKVEKPAFPQNIAFSTAVLWKPLNHPFPAGISPQNNVESTFLAMLKTTSCADFTLFSTVC
jgi:hypothetical protein